MVFDLLELPAWVTFEGVTFELRVFSEGQKELRLCYAYLMHRDDSPHAQTIDTFGHFENRLLGSTCSSLYLVEGIDDNRSMGRAIRETKKFLKKHGLFKTGLVTL